MAVEAMFKLARNVPGMGGFVEQVPKDQVPHQVEFSKVVQAVLAKIRNESDLGEEELDELSENLDDLVEQFVGETLTFFEPAKIPKGGENPIIPRWDRSTNSIQWYRVNAAIYRTFASMDIYRLPQAIEATFGAFRDVFTRGTIGLSASFGLTMNPLRDWQVLYANTRSNDSAGQLLMRWIQSMGATALHEVAGEKDTPGGEWVDAFLRMGGRSATFLGEDTVYTARAAQHLFGWQLRNMKNPSQVPSALVHDAARATRKAYDFYVDVIQSPETASRVTELKAIGKQVGWAPGMPMTFDQAVQLRIAIKQGTTDFSAAGEIGRVVNRMIPFFNAAIQGPRATWLSAQRRPGRFLFRMFAGMTIPTLVLWYRHKDEEWWKEMPAKERFKYWYFPIRVDGRSELLRIPRAFEIGALFAALPEMLADAWYTSDPKGASSYFDRLTKTGTTLGKEWVPEAAEAMLPNLRMPIVGEWAEQIANRDSYTDIPIVPRNELELWPHEQFNEYTSDASIAVARALRDVPGVPAALKSPRRLDHAIRGGFGPVFLEIWKYLGGDSVAGRELEKTPSDTYILGRLWRRGGELGTRARSIEEVYDRLEIADRNARSRFHEETFEERKRRLILSDARAALSALGATRHYAGDENTRRDLFKTMLDISKRALVASEAGERGPAVLDRKRAEYQRGRAEYLHQQQQEGQK
jgi:hypothetical protein